MSTSTSAVSLTPGTSAIVEVTVRRTGSFTGPVEVIAEALPAGVTASVSEPSEVALGITRRVVTVSAAPTATAGTGAITIRSRASGQSDQTATVSVTIVPLSTFTMTVAPTAISVERAQTGSITATVTRTNFTGPITFSVEGLPANVAAPSVTTTGNSATLNISPALTAPLGASTITIRARAAGLLDYTQSVALTITPEPGIQVATTTTSLPIVQGSSRTVTVTLTRTLFTGPVDVTVTGLPTGITVAPVTTTTNSATLTFVAAADAPQTATVNVTVRARGTGIAERTLTVPLRVVTAIASGTPVSGLSAVLNASVYRGIVVPAGATKLTVATTGASSDLDLYIYFNTLLTADIVCAAETGSGNETCTINNPPAGTYIARLLAFEAFSGVTLTVTLE